VEVKLPTVRPGDEILAEHITAIYDLVRRLQIATGENSELTLDSGDGGNVLNAPTNDGMWVKLTSRSSNAFAWTEQIPQTGGTWVDGYQSGTTTTDSAHEANSNTTLPTLPVIVWAWRAPASNEVTFLLGSC
jgi:hypothetical protein